MNDRQPLGGKHALVTGGARGIGAAIAGALLVAGARVTLAGRNADSLAVGADAMRRMRQATVMGGAMSGDVMIDYVVLDVTQNELVLAGFAQAAERFGPIDILINNAGQAHSAPFGKTDAALWREMMAVNLDGTFFCSQAALPGMLAAGWGRIVNVASTAGLVGYRYVSAYCAAKHGVIGLTRSLALELATKGINVNAVCPGFTDTDMLQQTIANIVAKTGRDAVAARAELAAHNPQQKLVQPQQVADAVLWLCMPGSDAMTGQALAVAGGEVMV
jgi:3-hydroxybutyrate dehydrogenase